MQMDTDVPKADFNRRRSKKLAEIMNLFRYLLVIWLLVLILIQDVVQKVDVYGASMEPAYQEGDVILVDKLHVRTSKIKRYDVIVFHYRYRDDQYYIKRIIGLPGETVQIADGVVYIDGLPLEDDYGTEPIEKPRRASEPVTLGRDEYFVLGDNRNDSSDSRDLDIGNISIDQIMGKAGIRIWRVRNKTGRR